MSNLRRVAMAAVLFWGLTWIPPQSSSAEDYEKVVTLLTTQTTNLDQPIAYPAGAAAEITALIVTLQPGEETGWHQHPVPLFGTLLSGEVTIDYGDEGERTYRAGDAFMEAMDTLHNGRNSGDEPARILAVFMGAEGVQNVVQP